MKNSELHNVLVRIRDGDTEAFQLLYTDMYRAVCSVAYAVLHDFTLSEDAAQETFLTIYTRCDQYRYQRNAASWIFTIAQRTALNMLGRQSRESAELPENACLSENPEDTACERDRLERLLAALDPTGRQIVVLHLIAGLKHRETAAILNMPLGTVLRRYRECLRQLAQHEEGRGS